jgi:hypothetical protein
MHALPPHSARTTSEYQRPTAMQDNLDAAEDLSVNRSAQARGRWPSHHVPRLIRVFEDDRALLPVTSSLARSPWIVPRAPTPPRTPQRAVHARQRARSASEGLCGLANASHLPAQAQPTRSVPRLIRVFEDDRALCSLWPSRYFFHQPTASSTAKRLCLVASGRRAATTDECSAPATARRSWTMRLRVFMSSCLRVFVPSCLRAFVPSCLRAFVPSCH